MLVTGIVDYVLEANELANAPVILGVVPGGMLEENFITSMVKADGNMLAVITIMAWLLHASMALLRRRPALARE